MSRAHGQPRAAPGLASRAMVHECVLDNEANAVSVQACRDHVLELDCKHRGTADTVTYLTKDVEAYKPGLRLGRVARPTGQLALPLDRGS